jgi:hypothetical protein
MIQVICVIEDEDENFMPQSYSSSYSSSVSYQLCIIIEIVGCCARSYIALRRYISQSPATSIQRPKA